MSDDDARRRELEARDAGLRDQVDTMLADLRRRAEDLQQKQAEAAERTHEVSSEDGFVTVRVGATGTVQDLELSPGAFERTSSDRLSRTITSVIREASGGAQHALRVEFAPMAEDLPDLTDFVPQGPSLRGLLGSGSPVQPPDPEAERAKRASDGSRGRGLTALVGARPRRRRRLGRRAAAVVHAGRPLVSSASNVRTRPEQLRSRARKAANAGARPRGVLDTPRACLRAEGGCRGRSFARNHPTSTADGVESA